MIRFICSIIVFCVLLTGCHNYGKEPTFAKWADKKTNWVYVPITVYDDADIKWFKKAYKAWNKDCNIFVQVDNRNDADIVIIRGPYGEKVKGKEKKKGHIKAGSYSHQTMTITLYGNRLAAHEYFILVHEFGHALGLKHDYQYSMSAMKPGIYDREDPPWPVV